jgi:hypothetical protein
LGFRLLYHTAFLESLLFSSMAYRKDRSVFGRKIETGLVVTTGAPAAIVQTVYTPMVTFVSEAMKLLFGSCEIVSANDTLQVDDSSKYDIQIAVPADKHRLRREQCSIDLQSAFDLGWRIATP